MQDEVRRESIKLFASYLNIMAAGCGVGAVVTAPVSLISRAAGAHDAERTSFLFAFIGLSLVASVVLHLLAQGTVRRLRR